VSPAAHALYERNTKLLLEVANLTPQRRLRDAQLCGRAGEGAGVGDRDEIAEVTQLHLVQCPARILYRSWYALDSTPGRRYGRTRKETLMLNLERFVTQCRAALAEPAPELAIKEILQRIVASPSDVQAALGTPRHGEIIPLHHERDLTILNVIWTPGMAIYPHDHRMWALIGLYGGREDNTFYRRSSQGLQVAGGKQLAVGDAELLGRSIIHAVANPLRTFTAAIHIYGGDFFNTPRSDWDPETLQERPFDIARGRKVFDDANERWRAECASEADA